MTTNANPENLSGPQYRALDDAAVEMEKRIVDMTAPQVFARTNTLRALARRGFVTDAGRLTPAGAEAVGADIAAHMIRHRVSYDAARRAITIRDIDGAPVAVGNRVQVVGDRRNVGRRAMVVETRPAHGSTVQRVIVDLVDEDASDEVTVVTTGQRRVYAASWVRVLLPATGRPPYRETVWCCSTIHDGNAPHFERDDCVDPHYTDPATRERLNASINAVRSDGTRPGLGWATRR